MNWIILIGDEILDIKTISKIHAGYKVTELTSNRIVVNFGEDHVFYDHAVDLIGEYEQEELEKIPFRNPEFTLMTYPSEKRMKEILKQDNFPKDLYIDDDNGRIVTVLEYLTKS